MEYILFVINVFDDAAIKKLRDHLTHLELSQNRSTKYDRFIKIICVDSCFTIAKLYDKDWLTLENRGNIELETEKEKIISEKRAEEKSCLSEMLLLVSDSLPYAGVKVRTVVIHPTLNCASNESNLPLFGALKKLSCWHNAEISLITRDDEERDDLKELATFINASVFPELRLQCKEFALWRGKVAVLKKLDGQGHVFPGFQLTCEPCHLDLFYHRLKNIHCKRKHTESCVPVMGRILEVLDEIDSRTLPSFMLSSHTLKLSTWSKHETSQTLMSMLQDMNENAVIARIAVYESDVVIDCSKKLSSQAWRDSLIAHTDYIQEQEEDLLSPVSFMFVLLMCDDLSPQGVKAMVLRDSSEVNSHIFKMESHIHQDVHSPETDNGSLDNFLAKQLHLPGTAVKDLNRQMTERQITSLQDWIDEMEASGDDAVMTADMLMKFLVQVQERFIDQLHKEFSNNPNNCAELPSLASDLDLDPALWPERLALQHHDSQKREMRRYQSSENVCLSSPLHPDEGSSNVIEVKDFLKLFNPEGYAANLDLSPLRQKSSKKLTRLASQSEASLQWPECKNTNFHGITYYKDKISEKNERHYAILREKLVTRETCSSFTTKHIHTKNKPPSTTRHRSRSGSRNLMSPNRRSPRQSRPSFNSKKEHARSSSKVHERSATHRQTGLKSPRKLMTLPSQLRRSPRKRVSGTLQRLKSDSHVLPPPPKRKRLSDQTSRDDTVFTEEGQSFNESMESDVGDQSTKKQSRSARHKKKLQEIVMNVLVTHGVEESNAIFQTCLNKLYQVSKFFVKALPNSRNLSLEMRNIAEGQVTQVVDMEKRRIGMKIKK